VAASLAAKETACCSFFTFELELTHGQVELRVSTSAPHTSVLAALTVRAEAQIKGNA